MIFKDVLIAVLLIASIVAVIFLIILIANATDTVKKVNNIMDSSEAAAKAAKEKADNVSESVKEGTAKIREVASEGVGFVGGYVSGILERIFG